jgi:Na+:H+ antiporter, NhaA family
MDFSIYKVKKQPGSRFVFMFVQSLIALFFFLVGLEIKAGLKDIKSAVVPVIAALGGMLVPALIYLAINRGSNLWAASMPTDIALALGVLSLLGKRVNPYVRIFLLTLAIADDLFSLIVLAVFYRNDLDPQHAFSTVVAAAIGLILPLRPHLLAKTIKVLSPISTYFIVPIIILVNIPWHLTLSAFTSSIAISIVIARSIGKIIGITLFAWIASKLGGRVNISMKEIAGVGTLAGMGLTVALVIAKIAATNDVELNQVRLGLFISAIISGIAGYIWLRKTPAKQ